MKPIGLRLFAWEYGYRKVRIVRRAPGRAGPIVVRRRVWCETYEDRIVRRPNRDQIKRRAIEDSAA